MKIRKTTGGSSKPSEVFSGSTDKTAEADESEFARSIAGAEKRLYQKTLNEMVEEILAQGRKLAEKADIRELRTYKRLVSGFLDKAVEGSHRFTREDHLDRRGRHKVYAVIKKVDRELELLTEEVMEKEKDNIKILERLDIIKGLILDIAL